ncbi:gephyrin-like molybdotransferase Glp [Serpentinicella alkaliphila]|uniref:Molybdopterin molybdenumtransferase n=1 Tax=Serpentinicella alkaliphila TaxID=1734049 RepID=A0A4R2TXV4_9FIRM|nr:gephyrin-like molybdotransferase Glp [Serpentinicella alkaliphila]QUH26848.1 molybdopterin molybdotransferase MoeA [Serpentinicella alkaliphila]TCQ08076.1 molybdopterin molybdochelatase [Serpentinicella alkaliphila]
MDMFTVMKREEVHALLITEFKNARNEGELVGINDACGRILKNDLVSKENIPAFRRSTVDGYAMRSKDTIGCSESMPAFLKIIGETLMGAGTDLYVKEYEAVHVPTGGVVPNGADCVCMIENTEQILEEVMVYRPAAPLENIISVGDDVKNNEVVLTEGTVIKTQHISVLAALGYSEVEVYRRPKVSILSTGDELVDIWKIPEIGEIRDVNTYGLKSMLTSIGCEVTYINMVEDDSELLKKHMEEALAVSDVLLVSGGSSVGTKDMTPDIINQLGQPGVLVHGVAIKPGKPTIIARVNNKAVFGLPGHPASCMISYKAIVEPFIREILLKSSEKERYMVATSGFQAHVSSGREVYYMVTLDETDTGYIAYPVNGKSGMVSLLSKAEGYIRIPMEKEGIEVGTPLRVYMFE